MYVASSGIDDPKKIWEIIISADIKWVIASATMGFLAIVARGLRWSNLLEPMGYFPKKWNNIHAVSLSYFVSLAIPRSGELVRCTAISQVEDIPVDKLFGTVILERVIDSTILLIFVGLAFLLNFEVFDTLINLAGTERTDLPEESAGFSLLNILILVILLGAVILAFIKRKDLAKINLREKISGFLSGMKEGFMSIKKIDKKWEFVIYSVFIWGMYYCSMMAMLWALDLDPFSWNEGLFLVVAGGIGTVIPTQNGLGTYHLFITLGVLVLATSINCWPELSEDGIRDLGYSLAWLQWGTQTIMMMVSGLVATIAFALQRKKLDVSS